jgi:hypothetical protein
MPASVYIILKNHIRLRIFEMQANHLRSFISALFSVLMLISCGSGGGGGMTAGGGIGGTGIISSGTLSAFGSIEVNGTNFDTSKAVVIVNGIEKGIGDESVRNNLDIGRVVTVEGTGILDDISAAAVRVIYNDNVRGPIESIDIDATEPTTKKIVILGQTVIVNVITKFKDTEFDGLTVNDVVAVSGFFDENGLIRATFLENIGDITTIYEVTGFVENLDSVFNTFMINGLKIDYSSIANNLPEGIPADGQFVEVEGKLAVSGEILARNIALADELSGEDGEEVEIMGFVTDKISDFEITVGNQMVRFDTNTLFVDGFIEDIAPGVKLGAEGSLLNGILVADEIEFWQPDQIEVEGIVTEIKLSVDRIVFTLRNLTGDQVVEAARDKDITSYENVTPEEITIGMNIEVKGVPLDIDISVLIADKVSLELD